MKLLRATKFASVLTFAVMQVMGLGFAQTLPNAPVATASAVTVPQVFHPRPPARAYPRLQLWSNETLTYLGMFSPDAIFRTPARGTGATGYSPGEDIPPAPSAHQAAPLGDVPPSMLLFNERVVENIEPPAHAQARAQAPSRVAQTRNRFVTYAYGRPSVLHAPRYIATDSVGRLIISDPDAEAVHVLDPRGKASFRIVAGAGRRLHEPAGVAVDADDNIYVADSERGMLVVFDRYGTFSRYIGNFDGENEFESPEGIAIDRKAGRLYLVDSPRNLVFMLDLSGKVLKRMGKFRDATTVTEFDDPTDIVLNHDHVYVLDGSGTRVHILNADCNLQGSFNLPHGAKPKGNRDNGLGADQQGNIYVSSFNTSIIRVYRQDGRLLAAFGQPGKRIGEFTGPNGLWIDSASHLYVADSGNGRVQLFQLQEAR